MAALLGGLLLGGVGAAGGMLAAGYERPVTAGADPVAATSAPATLPAEPEPTAEVDPYEVWLERAPADAPELSRDDAYARAVLGCGSNPPPGTVDAVLQEVYADHVDC